MKKNYRILHDLWVSLVGGYAGIPQDTRTIFSTLAQSDAIKIDGLLYLSQAHPDMKKKSVSTLRLDCVRDGGSFCQTFLDSQVIKNVDPNETMSARVKRKIMHKLPTMLKVKKLYALLTWNKFSLYPLDKLYGDFIWQQVFSKTLDSANRHEIVNSDFYYSDISFRHMQISGYFGRDMFLDTRGYDFMLFPDVRPVHVSPGTKKIIRYHDSFGFLCPDFFQTNHSKMHLNSLKACKKDSYFACNSENTRQTLVNVFPELEAKTFVVPPVVRPYPKMKSWRVLKDICLKRMSRQLCREEDLTQVYSLLNQPEEFDYILSLSTLEPRKNYVNLIQAWEKLNFEYKKNIKLVIVANKGWLAQDIEQAMRPHIQAGNIIHLSGVSSEEMPYIFSHAKLFAYLSFIEGFGSPPLEAMQCECPILAADNPTHRWSMEDAALYVNPYDVDDIAQSMAKLLYQQGAAQLSEQLTLKALQQVKKYSVENMRESWLTLFETLR